MNERQVNGTVEMQGEELAKVDDFKYLGSTVQSNGECGGEVKKRVQEGIASLGCWSWTGSSGEGGITSMSAAVDVGRHAIT